MMFRQLQRMHRDEQGMALIVALMVSFVVLMLSTVVVAQSIHSLDSSGYERQRLASVNAAEAGANAWWEDIQTNAAPSLSCTTKTATLSSQPNDSQYSAVATFYASDATTPMTCPFSSTSFPSFMRVVSTGTSEGETPREIETFARLNPIRSGFGSAILANGTVGGTTYFDNSFTVSGNTGNDGDIYILNGNLDMGNSTQIRGSVYVPTGSASMSNSNHVYGSLWANGAISMTSSARVDGDVKSNSGAITGANSASAGGSAYSGTTIGNGLAVAGTRYPNYTLPGVPTQIFPQFTYNLTDWAGYTVSTFSGASACTSARTFLLGAMTGNNVVRITGATPCTLSFANNTTINVAGDLAIITDWGIAMANNTTWATSGTVKKLMFLSTYGSCAGTGAASKNITEQNSTNYSTLINLMVYTPCTFTAANSNGSKGQAIAGNVIINNSFAMTYAPVLVPGLGGNITGFQQDIAYVREI